MAEFLMAFILFYLWHGMGITVGYHRLLAHRSFRCMGVFEAFWILGGYLAYQGSPIWWASIHRAHHRYADTPLDPHSPKYGIAHSLYGWMLLGRLPDYIDASKVSPDLVSNKLYKLLDCGGNVGLASFYNLIFNIVFRLGLWALFGWRIALASLIASMMVFTVPLFLNVVCHLPGAGYKNFATKDDGLNVWWVGLLGMGEGWHNNHHAFPGSAQTGLRWFELDVSWLTIKLGKMLGLVQFANVPSGFKRKLGQRQGALLRLRRLRKIKQLRDAAA